MLEDFYKLYFLCQRVTARTPQPGSETMEVVFFPPDALPELCTERIVTENTERAFTFYRAPEQQTLFD